MRVVRISILGERDDRRPARAAIIPALVHAGGALKVEVVCSWFSDDEIDGSVLANSDGLFLAPGSPHEKHGKVIESIRWARLAKIPCLGTCGGFQRMAFEYGKNELDIIELVHHELDPLAEDPQFVALECSIVGRESEVAFAIGSLVFECYNKGRASESFYCGYGLSFSFRTRLVGRGLKVSGFDSSGSARVLELAGHPFFMGTLFVPQVNSNEGSPHPIILAFLKAAMG